MFKRYIFPALAVGVLSGDEDMCSDYEDVTSSGVLLTPSYPDHVSRLTECQCALTAPTALDLTLDIHFSEEGGTGCGPRIWVSRNVNHSYRICPSNTQNASMLFDLDIGDKVILTLATQKQYNVRAFIHYSGKYTSYYVSVK